MYMQVARASRRVFGSVMRRQGSAGSVMACLNMSRNMSGGQATCRREFHGARTMAMQDAGTTSSATNEEASNRKTEGSKSLEQCILENALKHVGELKWTVGALAAGAQDAGYPSITHGVVANGPIDLVYYFMDQCHAQVRDKLQASTSALETMTVPERLKFGIRTQLELLEPVLSSWPQAMALGMQPLNAVTTLQKIAHLMDEIWYFAGDKSTDGSWYAKRAALTGVYTSTELFMLTDTSPNHEETWRFLDRSLERAATLGDIPRTALDIAGVTAVGVQSLVSAVVSLGAPLGKEFVSRAIAAALSTPVASHFTSPPPPPPPSASSPGMTEMAEKDMREVDQQLDNLTRNTV